MHIIKQRGNKTMFAEDYYVFSTFSLKYTIDAFQIKSNF